MPAVVRIGDEDVPHCSPMVRAGGSGNVFVNGRAVSRQGDLNTAHLFPSGLKCFVHAAPISTGSTRVFANGRGVGYMGASLTGCTQCGSGSSTVFCGA